jgi:hypothetical protein
MEPEEIKDFLSEWFVGMVNHGTDFPEDFGDDLWLSSWAKDSRPDDPKIDETGMEFFVTSKRRRYRVNLVLTLEESEPAVAMSSGV